MELVSSGGTYGVHVQRVHRQVIRVQVERLEQLLQGDLPALELVHDALGVHAVRLLDETQQVLLVHAGCSVDVGVHLGKGWRRGEKGEVQVGVMTVPGHKRELKKAAGEKQSHCNWAVIPTEFSF